MNQQDLLVFDVDKIKCAISINQIQEIKKNMKITPVYNAPKYIRGIFNLRGQIITVIDLRKKLGYESIPINREMSIIIISYKQEKIGLLTDKIVDIIHADPRTMEDPPSNINNKMRQYFLKTYKMENTLTNILNIDDLLRIYQE